jgi:integrase
VIRPAGGCSSDRGDDDLVFGHPHTGKPLDRSQVLKRFKRYCKAAGIGEQRFHDLRHTFGTHMAASGQVSLRQLQEWFGHARISTTEIYADWRERVRARRRRLRPPDAWSTIRLRSRSSGGPIGDQTEGN